MGHSATLRTDRQQIGHFWDNLPPGVKELRIPKPRSWRGTLVGFYDDREAFVDAAMAITGKDAAGVYVTLNPVDSALLARAANRLEQGISATSDADIPRLLRLLIDVDPVRPSGISATDAELAAALAVRDIVRRFLKERLDWPAPAAVIDSGNGGHLHYAIDLPNDAESVALLKRCLAALAALFNTDAVTIDEGVSNPSRISKVAGTIAAKGDSLPERPWRPVTGEYHPRIPKPIPVDSLRALAAYAPAEPVRPEATTASGRSWDMRDILHDAGIGYREKPMPYANVFELERCLTSDDHTDGACLLEFPSGALGYSCRHNRCQGKGWADVRGLLPIPHAPTPTGFTVLVGGKRYGGAEDTTTAQAAAAWPVLADEALHGLASEIVDAFDPHTEADKVAVLVTVLEMFGNAVGRSPHFMVGNSRHGTNDFAALVGETAKARKGTSHDGPRLVMDYANPTWGKERIQGGLSSGEGLIWAIRDPIYQRNRKTGVDEEVDPGVEDKRLLLIEEELSSVLKVIQRQGNTLSETVRRAWDSRDTLRSLTKNSPAKASNPHVSILAHITKDELLRVLTETDAANGFGNRFAWFCVKRSKYLADPQPLPDETARGLARKLEDAITFARKKTRVQRDAAAHEQWAAVYRKLSDGKPGLAGALIARAEAHVIRWSLRYALLDKSDVIRSEHLEAALALWEYSEASAAYLFGDATGDVTADRILSALRQTAAMTKQNISDYLGRNVKASDLDRALGALLSLGKVRRTENKATGGRPAEVWEAA